MKTFGLIGKNIGYSFSRKYFSEKFKKEKTDAEYRNFDLLEIEDFAAVLKENPELRGLNVTIPYKEQIIPFLSELDPTAIKIGAVNTIKIISDKTKGYNTDYYGFMESIKPFISKHSKALILGTGGASKAIAYGLQQLNIEYKYVSRTAKKGHFTYNQLKKEHLQNYSILINCTPLGTFPNIEEFPAIPVEFLSKKNLVFDLIYNPPESKLLQLAKEAGAQVLNGQKMLELQAEKAWEIWNS